MAYPFVVYLGLKYLDIRSLSVVLILVVVSRLALSKRMFDNMPWIPIASRFGVSVLALSLFFNSDLWMLFYPAMVNLAMLITFGYSLINKPCIIETFARIREKDLTAKAIRYTENVTKIWCLFFVFNGLTSVYTALYLTKEQWTLYNGLIAYVLMAIIFTVEFIVRQYVKKNNAHE
ncbi:septation protein IspZ [Thalassotalea ganghwensis]